ncbi:MAG: TSUP family transporter [Coriobacteriaceae bacterium]|jgi:uncharacterized membrane protein YfcA|nr:TSUP family transporter [Coriobacteriaceae bacterium]
MPVDAFMFFAVLALIGFFIGVFSGLLGIGGGTIMVSVFRLAFGLSPLMSTGTSLFAIVPMSLSGALSRIRTKTCQIPLGLAIGLGGALTSPVGVWLASISPAWLVMLTAACVIAYSALSMFTKALKMGRQPKASTGLDAPGFAQSPAGQKASTGKEATAGQKASATQEATAGQEASATQEATASQEASATQKATTGQKASASQEATAGAVRLTRRQFVIGCLIGLIAGLASGYIGVGGGFIAIPLMIALIGLTMKDASGTSLLAIIILAVPGVISQALLGNIDYLVGCATGVGSIPGAVVGALLVRVVPERGLRFVFSLFLILSAILLALNELHMVA